MKTKQEIQQEVFDQVCNHFVTQGRPAADFSRCAPDDILACFYRTWEGLKCAVGIFIPDEKYDRSLEGTSINCLLKGDIIPFEDNANNMSFLMTLQKIHDNGNLWKNPEMMVETLNGVAKHYWLNTDVLKSLDFSHIKLH